MTPILALCDVVVLAVGLVVGLIKTMKNKKLSKQVLTRNTPSTHKPNDNIFFTQQPALSLHFLILLILVFGVRTCLSNDTAWYSRCNRLVQCNGLAPVVGFPFWGGNQRPKDCGYPQYEIKCDDRFTTTMMINGMKYNVLDVNPNHHIVVLARSDYGNKECLKTLVNTTLDSTGLVYGPGTKNVTVLYGCKFPKSRHFGAFNCNVSGISDRNGYYMPGIVNPIDYGCHIGVVVPIQDTFEAQIPLIGLSKVIQKGFEAKYTFHDQDEPFCRICEGKPSGGNCGYDTQTEKTICLCPYGRENKECRDNSTSIPKTSFTNSGMKKHKMTLIIIGICVGGLVAAISVVVCIVFAVKKGQRTTNQPSSSSERPLQSTLTNPSPSSIQDVDNLGFRHFSYSEIEQATKGFSKLLGEGGNAQVYYGQLPDGREVAVKRFVKSDAMKQFYNEVDLLLGLTHENLVKLIGCFAKTNSELIILYEYIPYGTLADHLHGKLSNSNLLSWPVRVRIATEIAEALYYLHQKGIVHRDVKSDNILLDYNLKAKVADFGLTRVFREITHVSTNPQGTPGYIDPQYYRCFQMSDKSDVYSLGVVLMELVSSKPAVNVDRGKARENDANLALMTTNRIQNNAIHELVDMTLGYRDDPIINKTIVSVVMIAGQCLEEDREPRPSMKQVLDLLKDVNKDLMNEV